MSWSQLSFSLARKRGTSWGAHDLVMNRLLSWTSAISRFCWRNTCLSHTLLTQIPDVKLQMCELCVPLLVSLEWRIKECITVWFNVARSLKGFKCLTHFSTSGRLQFLKCFFFFEHPKVKVISKLISPTPTKTTQRDKQSAVNMIFALTPNITQVTLLWLNKSLVYQPVSKKWWKQWRLILQQTDTSGWMQRKI